MIATNVESRLASSDVGASSDVSVPRDERIVGVLLATETGVIADLLCRNLDQDARFRVIAKTVGADEITSLLRNSSVDVVVMHYLDSAGLMAARALRTAHPSVPLVVFGLPQVESVVVAWASVGVLGCLTLEASLEDLLRAVAAAAEGGATCSSVASSFLLQRVRVSGYAASKGSPITPRLTHREQEILQLVDHGLSNKQIAATLHIELSTVKNHVRSIFMKLGVRSRAEARDWVAVN